MTKQHSVYALFVSGFVLLVAALLAPVAPSLAASPVITFGAPITLSNAGTKSVFPVVTYDAGDKAHVAWMQFDGDKAILYYRNNVGGSFGQPFAVTNTAKATTEHNLALAVAPDGVHLFYTRVDGTLREAVLAVSANGGVTIRSDGLVSDGVTYTPNAITDSSGRVHIAWLGGDKQIRHRVAGVTRAVRPNGNFQNLASLAATDDGQVHVTFRDDAAIGYSIFNGNTWQRGDAPVPSGKLNQTALASDGRNLYLVFSTTEGDPHRVYYSTRALTGGWSTPLRLSDAAWADFPHVFASRANNTIYATWDARGPIQVREIIPGVGPGALSELGKGTEPFGAAGPGSASVIWQDKSTGLFQVMLATASLASRVPSGSMTINGGAAITNQANVSVGLTNTSPHVATQYSLRDGASLSSGAFSNPSTAPFTLDTSDGACRAHTVSGTLSGPGGTSAPFGASIVYDPSVDPNVEIRGTLADPGRSASPAAAAGDFSPGFGPASGGDPAHTRFEFFYANVTPGINECSGIKGFSVSGAGVSAGPIMPNVWSLNAGPGTYDVTVGAEDNAGNAASRAYKLFYDVAPPTRSFPAGDIPVVAEEIDGKPVLNMSGLSVQDNIFTGGGADKQYWGYWVVVKRDDGSLPTEAEWQSFGRVVPGQLGNTVRWNIRDGLVGSFVPGSNYRVYVSVLDGAGNPSQVLKSVAFQVNTLPPVQLYMPLVRR